MKHFYWVGPRKSDISNVCDMEFYGSVTIFGDGKDGNRAYCLNCAENRVNHNVADKNEDLFFYNTIKSIIENDKDALFYFYNPNCVYYIEGLSEFIDRFVCVNNGNITAITNNKVEFQKMFDGVVPLLDKRFDLHRNNCDYAALIQSFGCTADENKMFVFQAPVSSGGNGTYLVKRDNVKQVVNLLTADGYIVSIYENNNIPVNIHAIIFDDRVLLSPGSIQIMREDDYRLLYRGADFISYRTISECTRKKFEGYVRNACEILRQKGYRGVCGIDGIVCGDDVKLLELNNRFQASSGLINAAAARSGLPSLQKINMAAFYGEWDEMFLALENLRVDYSNYFYTDNGTLFHGKHIHDVCKTLIDSGEADKFGLVALEDDGYCAEQRNNALAYLFRIVLNTNITAVSPAAGSARFGMGNAAFEQTVTINENICEPDKEKWYDTICPQQNANLHSRSLREIRNYYLHLKIALMMQGVTVSSEAKEYIVKRGGMRPATNNAVDIKITVPLGKRSEYMIVNAPIDIAFVRFSPFEIVLKGSELYLCYYGAAMMSIEIYPVDPVAEIIDENGVARDRYTHGTEGKPTVPYSEVAFLSTDRLRVHLTNSCIFKCNDENGNFMGCKFCNVVPSCEVFDLDTIDEVVGEYCKHCNEINLTHFLVGGQTAPENEQNKIVEIIKIIRRHARFAPIYAMVVPYSEQTIKKMYDAGMSQLACNIEVFDDELALKYMPGKRRVKKSVYVERLKYATTLMGRRGNVRSMIIVGLEPHKSFTDGIRELASNGIQPILSIFRPLPDTPMAYLQAPSMRYIAEVYEQAQIICKEYGLLLGPDCINCQNNTLALPAWLEK